MEKPVAVIPSRYAAQRFPGKPLALVAGRPLVEHVYRRCVESGAFSRVLVATDDERIAKAARNFGAQVALTSPSCQSGTDRVAEVARTLDAEVFINVQGDEPAVHPESLALLARAFEEPSVKMATLVRPLAEEERQNPNVVKAVVGLDGFALYFSRADLPYQREASERVERWAHVGLYGYRKDTLLKLAELRPSPLELAEKLEQLRALENGVRIYCGRTSHRSCGVDRPEDIALAEALLRERGLAH